MICIESSVKLTDDNSNSNINYFLKIKPVLTAATVCIIVRFWLLYDKMDVGHNDISMETLKHLFLLLTQ